MVTAEKFNIDKDIKTLFITATSFPEGVLSAHQKLHSILPSAQNRTFYGISWPEDGKIIYKAAAEELYKGEAEQLGLETFTIKKGEYISDMPYVVFGMYVFFGPRGLNPDGMVFSNSNEPWLKT